MNLVKPAEILHNIRLKMEQSYWTVVNLLISNRPILLRAIIIFGVVVYAGLLGLVGAKLEEPLYMLVASTGPILLVGLQFILSRPELVPVTILGVALFVPFSLPTGTGSRLVMSLLVTVLFAGLWLINMLVKRNLKLAPSPVNKPALGFMAVTLFSIAWSIVFRDPLVYTPGSFIIVQVAAAVVMIMLPAAMLMVGNFIHEIKPLLWMVVVMLAAGVVGAAKFYLQLPLPVRTEGMFSLWVIALAFGLALFLRSLEIKWRLALLALAGAYFYWSFVLNISWLAGWLPGLAALGVLTFMRSKKLAIVFLILLALLISTDVNYYLGRVIENEAAESGYSRLAAWESNWGITRDHLLFGTGPAGYAVYYMSYFPDSAMATHSNYIDIIAQTGLVGLLLCVWLFGALAWKGYRLSLRLRSRGDTLEALANIAFAGTVACILIMGFGDWLFPFAYTQTIAGFDYAVYNWLFMGMILVIERLADAEVNQGEPASPAAEFPAFQTSG